MTKLRKRYLIRLMLLLSGALATYAWNTLPDGPRWQRGYPQIVEGDSEQNVLEIMGNRVRSKIAIAHATPEILFLQLEC